MLLERAGKASETAFGRYFVKQSSEIRTRQSRERSVVVEIVSNTFLIVSGER